MARVLRSYFSLAPSHLSSFCTATTLSLPATELPGDKTMKAIFVRSALVLAILISSDALAQVATGTPPFGSFAGGPFDTVNLADLNAHFGVPIISKPGAGLPFHYMMDYESSFWVATGPSGSMLWQPTNAGNWGWRAQSEALTGSVPVYSTSGSCFVTNPESGLRTKQSYPTTTYSGYTDPGGTFHAATIVTTEGDSSCDIPVNPVYTGSKLAVDGSGYLLSVNTNANPSVIVTNRSGVNIPSPGTGSGAIIDTNGNELTTSVNASTTTFTDTLGMVVLTVNVVNSTQTTYTYTGPSGAQEQFSFNYSQHSVQTNFGCSGITEYPASPIYLLDSITNPDSTSYSFQYESTPGFSGKTTGRIASVTLPTGGTISYAYQGGNNGIDCTYQTVPKLTRTLLNNQVTTYTITHSTNNTTVDTVIDPAGNQAVYTFAGSGPLTDVKRYQGTSTILSEDVSCYNTAFSSCSFSAAPTTSVTFPITSLVVMHKVGSMSTTSATETHYDAYSNVTYSAAYDFGGSTPVRATTTNYYQAATSCGALSGGSNINNRPCEISTTQGGSTVSDSKFTYDSHGNLLKTSLWNGSAWIGQTTANSYNSNGTPSATYDVANNATAYAYNAGSYTSCGGCTQYPFPTSLTKAGLTTSSTWNGAGGVKLTDVDPNGNTTTYGYTNSSGTADPFWRVNSVTDPLSNVVWIIYGTNTVETKMSFSSSVEDSITTVDGYGRKIRTQTANGSSYDTVTYSYGYSSGTGETISTSVPCSAALGADCTTGFTVATFEGAARPYSTVDGGGGTLAYTYNQNDVVSTLSPHPNNENNKTAQVEFDGLGRTKSACSLLSSGGSSCGQVAGGSGIPTSFTYTTASGTTTTTGTRGAESRTTVTDSLGRITSQTTPEGGTTTYVFDSASNPCGWGVYSSPGNLIQKTSANGNTLCYQFDALHRVGSITGVPYGGGSGIRCQRFYYDSSQGALGSIPSGVVVSNGVNRMVEAETDTCAWPVTQSSMITDEWFSYDKLGNLTDVWELTPHSGGYFHTTVGYFANGVPSSLSGLPGMTTLTYGINGNGRWSTAMRGVATIIGGVTYGPLGPTYVSIGAGTDEDVYSYDANSGRMTQYQLYVGSANTKGVLTWNANGTLGSLAITDGFNAGGSQTCAFSYDDVARLTSDNCGSVWAQTFSYDQYDNLTKSGSSSWNPGYNDTKNQYSSIGATYDGSGNITYDGTNYYTWDAYGKMLTVNGTSVTYDALGRAVETATGGTYTEILYSPLGESAILSNPSTVYSTYIPLPGGGYSSDNATANTYIHSNWLGTSPLASSIPATGNGTVAYDRAFAPHGEVYDNYGFGGSNFFTGDVSWNYLFSMLYDTPNRELNNVHGRWLSPDPAGAGWNQYAYVSNNPLAFIDPLGLCSPNDEPVPCYATQANADGGTRDGNWFGGGGYGDGTPPSLIYRGGGQQGGSGNNATIGAAPPQPPPLKPGCTQGGLLAGLKAAGSDFFSPPGADPVGDVGDALRNKDVQRAAVGTLYVVANSARYLAPAAEVAADFIPVAGEVLLAIQLGHALYEGGKAYKESIDQCYGTP